MHALKLLVGGLAVVILIGLGGMLGVIGERLNRGDPILRPKEAPAAALPAAPAAPVLGDSEAAPFGRLALSQPPGTTVARVSAAGELLVLELAGEGGPRLAIVDPRRGRLLGIVEVAARP